MISAINNTPSFGSKFPTRVVKRTITSAGKVTYEILPQSVTDGVYGSFVRQVNAVWAPVAKDKRSKLLKERIIDFVKKWATVDKDFNLRAPQIGSTEIASTDLRKYGLTGPSVDKCRALGSDFGRKGDPYAPYVRTLLNNEQSVCKQGYPLGVDLIVDETKSGKYQLADVDIMWAAHLSKPKPPKPLYVQGTLGI